MLPVAPLTHGAVTLRPIRARDARELDDVLLENRQWLRRWEATDPGGPYRFDTRGLVRALMNGQRAGTTLPFIIEVDGVLAGQLNVSGITFGSVSSASVGYWISEEFAGRNVTPTAVALATDHCFGPVGLHRIEICIRPENAKSLRVVQKLGYRYEGLRRRYIHIDGDWRDHFCFALVREDVRGRLLERWVSGATPGDWARIPDEDWRASGVPHA